jgi:hypothetical protein
MWQGWVNGVIGIWLIVSGIVGAGFHAQWNYILGGVIMAVIGVWGYWMVKAWQSVVAGILGLWLLVSSLLVPSLMNPLNMIIVGVVAGVLSFWECFAVKPKAKVA